MRILLSDTLRAGSLAGAAILLLVAGPGLGAQQHASSTPSSSSSAGVRDRTPQEGGAPERLHLMVGRSLVINSPARLKRVSVADPNIADAIIVSPNQLLINGKTPGGVSLVLWDEHDQSQTFDLMVDMDILGLSQKIREVFPAEPVRVEASKDVVMLTGRVTSKSIADKIVEVVSAITPKVISMIEVPVDPAVGEVLLEVKFAEVNRSAVDQFAFNFISLPGPTTRTAATTSTQQFAPPQLVDRGNTSTIGLTDLLNVFIFRPDVDIGGTIRALRQQNLLQILAEPNLLTQTGKEASFLAGGEFPFPVLQGGGQFQGITIQFKEFGVRLSFTPTLTAEGKIHLKVQPEVSALDFNNAFSISGFLIPALSTRRVITEMHLEDGQSFAIAGLVNDQLVEAVQKIPFLGDIPLLGKLFRSHAVNKTKTELLVVVTPRVVKRPEPPGELKFPKPFLEPAVPQRPGSPPGE